ncbi:hypothetical protein SAMN04489735_10743 [Aneurinibacillus thermoaerophilus]|uniref:Uncharacterized protein n=1 Tax=Aneurinibacillus thermoaerophilus TaxID=143495 RepID=A0A1G8FMF4_ANETH|nr:hypothetical protein [Aneurinibacillus thermoaerophilus]MED0678708.1 hypothetical protein [Aneurinibacillus thermoaerophilus]SDH83343.1 hypothetical protein SAMN04489735_10743 [Aneurinibacillus thermoaerophilus]
MLWKNKCLGGKRCVRNNLYTNEFYEQKLKLLANSCELPYLTLGSLIVCKLLDSPSFVYKVQKTFNTIEHYWITAEYDAKKKIIYKQEITADISRKVKRPKSKYLNFPRDRQLKLSYQNEHDLKLSMLARSCNLRKGEMAALILHYGLDTSEVIMFFQERYNVHSHHWVTPVHKDGIVAYVLSP